MHQSGSYDADLGMSMHAGGSDFTGSGVGDHRYSILRCIGCSVLAKLVYTICWFDLVYVKHLIIAGIVQNGVVREGWGGR